MDNVEILKKHAEVEISEIFALKRVFKTDDGKKALDFIKKISLAGQQAYVPGMPAKHTIFRNGCQQVYIDLKATIDADIKGLENTLKNAQKQEETYEL